MEKAKLTVRVSSDLLENARRFAKQNHTNLTALIEAYLRRIPAQGIAQDTPIVRRLIGVLSLEAATQDHKKHLEEKYDQ